MCCRKLFILVHWLTAWIIGVLTYVYESNSLAWVFRPGRWAHTKSVPNKYSEQRTLLYCGAYCYTIQSLISVLYKHRVDVSLPAACSSSFSLSLVIYSLLIKVEGKNETSKWSKEEWRNGNDRLSSLLLFSVPMSCEADHAQLFMIFSCLWFRLRSKRPNLIESVCCFDVR